jgi:hypothetical protein
MSQVQARLGLKTFDLPDGQTRAKYMDVSSNLEY